MIETANEEVWSDIMKPEHQQIEAVIGQEAYICMNLALVSGQSVPAVQWFFQAASAAESASKSEWQELHSEQKLAEMTEISATAQEHHLFGQEVGKFWLLLPKFAATDAGKFKCVASVTNSSGEMQTASAITDLLTKAPLNESSPANLDVFCPQLKQALEASEDGIYLEEGEPLCLDICCLCGTIVNAEWALNGIPLRVSNYCQLELKSTQQVATQPNGEIRATTLSQASLHFEGPKLADAEVCSCAVSYMDEMASGEM
ncbi:unnamed protein product [Protopolystoma xenopodis]|uniref:Ig-like domain-containing protein n=1 Tax=Protopolystoma xenopodis TaxID=117903 RepID=A0A3S5CTB8_9PLAT|nr:unnamed protein product [Protopolystoma xenopodis]